MKNINPSQQKAIDYDGGHLLVVAGPGTGKTHTLVLRIARAALKLHAGQKILAVTFTNKAARQMEERLEFLDKKILNKVTFGTFHGFCLHLLNKHSMPKNILASDNEIKDLVKLLWKDEKKKQRKERLKKISFWKATSFLEEEPSEVSQYNAFLRSHFLYDYDDLLLGAIKLLKNEILLKDIQKQYPFIFIDEYQDINFAQNILLKTLSGDQCVVTAIGDPCQAIYGFRGSDVRFFNNFFQDFKDANLLKLTDNYRSAPNLLEASSQIIEKQGEFPVPELIAHIYEQGDLIVYEAPTDKAEAEYVVHSIEKIIGGTSMFSHDSKRAHSHKNGTHSFGEIVVLYRLNSQNRLLKEAFERSGIPFQVSGELSFIEEEDMVDFIKFLKNIRTEAKSSTKELIEKAEDSSSWRSRIEKNQRLKERVDRLKRIALRIEDIEEFFGVISLQKPEDEGIEGVERVSLMTLHSSKGLEFPVVFIVGCEEGLIPYEGNDDRQEERRLFYVGMTRAKERLVLVSSKKRSIFGKAERRTPSKFLYDIQEKLKKHEKQKAQRIKKIAIEKQFDLFK